MKIVSWNCNGKFREKFKIISELDADIYVIQECENPDECNNVEYKQFAANHFWTGENKNKGLGIFLGKPIEINLNDWPSYCLRSFLSVNVNRQFNLLAVWACRPYIEEYYIYQCINYDRFKNDEIVIIGDFNSNKIWDKEHGSRNHSKVVDELNQVGIQSVYHNITGELQGEETKNTFYLYRHLDKGFHIDHCFSNLCVKKYQVFDNKKWLQYSDHMPILLNIACDNYT